MGGFASDLLARVRGLALNVLPEGEGGEAFVNPRGELLVANALPKNVEIVRMGESGVFLSGTVNAALTAVPTTVAGLCLLNRDTRKTCIIESFGVVEVVVDATQQNQLALFAGVGETKYGSAFSSFTTLLADRKSTPSGSVYGGKCEVGHNVTHGVNVVWMPHGPCAPGAAAVAGGLWRVTEAVVEGGYLVPPNDYMFMVHAVKAVATASQLRFFIRWHEAELRIKG